MFVLSWHCSAATIIAITTTNTGIDTAANNAGLGTVAIATTGMDIHEAMRRLSEGSRAKPCHHKPHEIRHARAGVFQQEARGYGE